MQDIKENIVPIVYFDGQCNFCHSLVKSLKRKGLDTKAHLLPFQLVSNEKPTALLFIDETEALEAGEAALSLLTLTGGFYKNISKVLKQFPKNLVNRLYYYIANNRYRLFGTKSCEVHYS